MLLNIVLFVFLILFSWFKKKKIFLGSKIFNSWAFGEGSMFQWFYWWIIGNISFGTAGICYNVLWLPCTMKLNFALSDLYFDINRLLWFQDYHRFHFPVSGTIQKIVNIPGCLYTVCDCRWYIWHVGNPWFVFSTDFLFPFPLCFSFFLFQVNPIAVNSKYCNVFTENKRVVSIISTAEFGKVCFYNHLYFQNVNLISVHIKCSLGH